MKEELKHGAWGGGWAGEGGGGGTFDQLATNRSSLQVIIRGSIESINN